MGYWGCKSCLFHYSCQVVVTWEEWAYGDVEVDSEGSGGCELRCEKGILVELYNDPALKEQQVLSGGADPAPERQQFATVGKDRALEEPRVNGVNNWIGDFGCRYAKRGVFCGIKDAQIRATLEEPTFSKQECLSVLQTCGGVSPGARRGFELVKSSVVFGLSGEGKAAGVSECCVKLVKYLNRFVKRQECEATWTAIGVSCNGYPGWGELSSRDWPCCICLLGKGKGGGRWVEDGSDSGRFRVWTVGQTELRTLGLKRSL